MHSRFGLLLLFFAFFHVRGADQRWTRMKSPNFEMYTTAGERSARDTLRYFEQVHSFFMQRMPDASARAKQSPVQIVAFNSLKEYEPFRPNEFATAYYHSTAERDYIVMSHTGSETFPLAIHEYTHLVVQHANMKFPPWLNEGIAELYSTLRPMGDKILVGSLIEGRRYALLNEKWVPLATILDADRGSPYYNEKNRAGSLYNEGWALTHMLMLDNKYRLKFPEAMQAISSGTPSRSVLEQIYGPLSGIEKDLQAYLRGSHFQAALIPAKLEKISDDLAAEPAAEFDVNLLLTRLKDHPGNEKETEEALEGLIAADAKRPEPHIDLGYLFWRENRSSDARAEFAKAFDLGSRNPRLLWDYGRMEISRDDAAAIRALAELLSQNPDRLEVRLDLAAAQLNARSPKDALETLKPVKKVTPEDAPRLLTLLARAYMDTGDRVNARNAAAQLKTVARADEQRQFADRLLQILDNPRPAPAASAASAPAPSAPPASGDGRPVIRRRERTEGTTEIITATVRRPSFTGKFVELQCADPAKLVIDTPEGKKFLLIDDPSRLLVNGKLNEKMDLACGRQKPANVRVEYDPATTRPGVDGLARAIFFEN